MSYPTLQEYVSELERRHELARVQEPLDPVLEISALAVRAVRGGGPAILVERPVGSSFPVLVNAFGTQERAWRAIGVQDPAAAVAELEAALRIRPPMGVRQALGTLARAARLARLAPRTVTGGVCQEVVAREPSLAALPVLKCWPQDAGRFVTLPMVFTRHPETGERNVGMYRMQVYDERTAGMHWHPHKVGAAHYRAYEARGERMPVAVALGGDPAIIYSATAPLPEGFDEMLLAGWLRRRPVEMTRCRTCELEVPAGAEMVLEGYVEPGERRLEGPFGDHTGYYSPAAPYPVFHLTCLTHRREAIYPATVVGRPPMEDCYLGKITERLFLPLVRLALPELVDINLPIEGIFHNLALVSIRKAYPGHAYKVMQALWGMGQFAFTKIIAVFDEEVDVQDWGEAVWRLGNNIDPERDVQFVRGPVDTLNHAAPRPGFGSKMGVDATRKWPEEGFDRQWPEDIRPDPAAQARAEALWQSLQPGGTR